MAKISYQKVLDLIRFDMYQEIVDSEEIFNLGVECKWKNITKNITDENVDPVDIYSNEAESLQNMLYKNKLMNICLLCEFWEQDLYDFMKINNLYTVPDNTYKFVKDAFNEHFKNCSLDNVNNFPKIKEMRELVNAIKHGVGRSLNTVRTLTNDSVVADSNVSKIDFNGEVVRKKQIEFDCNTLTSRTLNVDGKLKEYHKAIVQFWKQVYNEANQDSTLNV